MGYSEAQKKADKKYQSKIHKATIIFKPEDEELWDKIHERSKGEGVSPFVLRILRKSVYNLSTD